MSVQTTPTPRYGFTGRLRAEFPSQFVVDITEVCNLACVHCAHPEFKESEHYGANKLDPQLCQKLVEEVRQHGRGITQYIRFSSSGEPLLHPKAYEMIEYAVRRSQTTVSLTTNGTLLNEKRMSKLMDTGLHVIDVSIDAFTPETYAAVRVNGDLAVTRANVLRLIELAAQLGGRTKIVVSFIEQPQNRHEIPAFEKFWNDHGADYVIVRRLHSNAGASSSRAVLMWEKTADSQRRPCLYPWERMVLNPRGYLSFCPADWTHGSSVIDYRKTTALETWRGEFYQRLRAAHLNNDFSCHGFCGQCPDWAATRWPHEGRSFADMIEDFKHESD